jgi:hypothetical protein
MSEANVRATGGAEGGPSAGGRRIADQEESRCNIAVPARHGERARSHIVSDPQRTASWIRFSPAGTYYFPALRQANVIGNCVGE